MSTTYYSLYVQKVMTLAKTLVIKSDAAALAINSDLQERGHTVDSDLPETWKYYCHLAGEYHPTDVTMTVTSLDTLESIEFTKENLRFHRATARFYQYGNKYYEDLVEQYPDQEMLILGILNPVNKQTAIDVPNGTILYANPDLIEPQETNLLPELQGYITRFLARWHVEAYRLVDDLYPAAQLGIMYLNIPLWILNIRLDNCHTRFAHSFHIREYLASHNRLDRYIDQLTIKQQLWLYRNIRYIERNAGKQETFEWLVQNILTDRGIPLAEYVMRHNLEEMPDNLLPEIDFLRNAVNEHYSPGVADVRDLYTVLEEENPLARSNPDVFEETLVTGQKQFAYSLSDNLPTKMLDSSITDLTDSGVITLSDFLLNHWLYWGNTDRYTTALSIPHPQTGDLFQVPADDAFALYLYCYNVAMGQKLNQLPRIAASGVRKDLLPTRLELEALSERRYVTDDAITDILDRNPSVNQYVSTAAFKEAVDEIYDRALVHYHYHAVQPHQWVRGQLKALCDHLYMEVPCNLAKDGIEDYATWLAERGYDVVDLTPLEHEILAHSIVEAATGVDLSDRNTLKDMQGAMLRLMSQLSSYSIQFIQNINAGPILMPDDAYVRLGDEWVKGYGGWASDLVGVDILDAKVNATHEWKIHINEVAPVETFVRLYHQDKVNPLVNVELDGKEVNEMRGEGIYVNYAFTDEAPDNRHIVVMS